MKRQVTFDFENGEYVLKEHSRTIFHIDGKELKFISLDFYNGVYKDKTAAIELINKIGNDDFKKGRYVFEWLTDIVTSLQKELNDPELSENTDNQSEDISSKTVYLFEMSACAGSGFYSDGPSRTEKEIDSPYPDADYAVKILGKSMEPTIPDQSIVFVKKVDELQDGEIGIFVVDGNVMCKRYKIEHGESWLQPDNDCDQYDSILLNDSIDCILQGKVLLV